MRFQISCNTAFRWNLRLTSWRSSASPLIPPVGRRGYREGDDQKREDEEEREDDPDSDSAPHTLLFEPANHRAQCASYEESDDEHEENRPELDQEPHGSEDEDERCDRLGR